MREVEHWWNGVVAGMARRDIYLYADDDTGWTVEAHWWREQTRVETFGHNEAAARMWIGQLKELFPGKWKGLGPARRPGSKS